MFDIERFILFAKEHAELKCNMQVDGDLVRSATTISDELR